VANLTIGTPQNPYSGSQSSNAPSAPDASAQWSAVVRDQKAAGYRGQPDQTTTTNNGAGLSHIGTTNNGGQPNQTGTPGQTAHQKPAGGSSWSLWIHGGLTAGSFLPSFVGAGFSAADGIVYSVERDRTNAALSFGAAGVGLFTDAGVAKVAALGLGVASKALKVGEAAVKVEKEANSVVKVGEAVVTAEKEANTAAKVGEAAKPVAAQSATAVDSGATSIRKADRRPAWLKKRVEAGQQFDRVNRHRYPVNELEVTDKAGNKFRLDSHHPQKGEIVSRKFTPFSEVKPETGIGYLREMLRKYPPGARISESRFNPKTLRGQLLTGNLILEVPVQKSTVPKAVLDYANKYGIVIRDVNGVRYR
jgi:hypothetical protein